MPFIRISVDNTWTPLEIKAISDGVYNALIESVHAPVNDKFQVITRHTNDELIFSADYLGIKRSKHFIAIQIFLYPGRTVDEKKLLYKTVNDKLSQDSFIRKEDVFINLVEVPKENWSYGNGEAQFAD